MTVLLRPLLAFVLSLLVVGCSLLPSLTPDAEHGSVDRMGERHPDVIAVELRPAGDGVFDVAVTLSSPYDTPERYADGWRVLDPQGRVLGVHELLHDHAAEQPFTRTQRGLEIPPHVAQVTVEGRDSVNGFGGATVTADVPR